MTFPCVVCGDPVEFSAASVADEFFDETFVTCQFCIYDELPDDVRAMKGAKAR
jgi:acid stress-induced BolA-like protein IbaG/YrbA